VQGQADAVVDPRCADQLAEQAEASLQREHFALGRVESSAPGAAIDVHGNGELRLRRIDLPGLGHEWSGGPGGHPYCSRGGAPLAEIVAAFLRDTGVLPAARQSGQAPAAPEQAA